MEGQLIVLTAAANNFVWWSHNNFTFDIDTPCIQGLSIPFLLTTSVKLFSLFQLLNLFKQILSTNI